MSKTKTQPPAKKSRINKKNRSAWILSLVLISLMTLRLVAGISRPLSARQTASAPAASSPAATAIPEEGKAESAMRTFFNLLAEKRFVEAVTYFGGSFDALAAVYPQDANDAENLLQDSCQQNPCLPIHSVVSAQNPSPNNFTFTVTFSGEDGRLLTHKTADGSEDTKFSITVVKENDHFLVQNLP